MRWNKNVAERIVERFLLLFACKRQEGFFGFFTVEGIAVFVAVRVEYEVIIDVKYRVLLPEPWFCGRDSETFRCKAERNRRRKRQDVASGAIISVPGSLYACW